MVANAFGLAVFLSVLNTKFNEYFITPLFEQFGWPKKFILYVSLLTGLAIAILGKIDVVTTLGKPYGVSFSEWVNWLISGVLIGGGSNMIHDIWDTKFSGQK